MTVLITLTAAGTDTGPFSLFSNTDGYTLPFATGISKATLLGGYSSTAVPDGTTTIRIKSAGVCVNSIDVGVVVPTTTTTTTAGTTTTTTTATPSFYEFGMSTPGLASSGLACADTGPFTYSIFSDLYPLDFGHTVYTDNTLTTEIVGGELWYQWGADGSSYQIGNDGVIMAVFNC